MISYPFCFGFRYFILSLVGFLENKNRNNGSFEVKSTRYLPFNIFKTLSPSAAKTPFPLILIHLLAVGDNSNSLDLKLLSTPALSRGLSKTVALAVISARHVVEHSALAIVRAPLLPEAARQIPLLLAGG